MRTYRSLLTAVLVAATSTVAVGGGMRLAGRAPEPGTVDRAAIGSKLAGMPLTFVENRGQLDPAVSHYVTGGNTSIYFGEKGATYALRNPDGASRWAVKWDFVGARAVAPVTERAAPGVVSYFAGPRERWATGIPTAHSLAYRDLWPGIDVTAAGRSGRFEYDVVVAPGADPAQVRFSYRGATDVQLTEDGALRVTTPAGSFTEQAPFTYQDVGGRRLEVPSAYRLRAGSEPGRWDVSFALGTFDPTRPLVIDPVVLVYVGFVGGTDFDFAEGIAVDGSGAAYISGQANSSPAEGFPVAVGPALTATGASDAWVAKLNPAGTAFVYIGFIGGTARADDVGVDAAGNAYVIGTDGNVAEQASFPATVGPALTRVAGGFVAKINATGTTILYAGWTWAAGAIAVDAAGHAYVTGAASAGAFALVGPDTTSNGGADAWVAKVALDGSGYDYAGFIGGSGSDGGKTIAVDLAGNAYVAGSTVSTDLPVAGGPGIAYSGAADVFVARVKADGTGLDYLGYLGGSDGDGGGASIAQTGNDFVFGIAVDASGNAFVAGETFSTQATFPVTVGPDLTFNGLGDAFVAKVAPTGTLLFAGYIGGNSTERAYDVATDTAGNAYVTGFTSSAQKTFPTLDGPDTRFGGACCGFANDAFVTKVRGDGTGLVYSGFIGGKATEEGRAIAVDGSGAAYVAGFGTTPKLARTEFRGYSGNGDGFVAKISAG